MNKLKTISLSLLLGLALTGCEDILEDNINYDRAHDNTPDQALPVIVFYAQQIVYDHSEYNIYLSQCLTTMGKSQTGSYPYKQGWEFLNINRHPQWRRHYYDIGANVRSVMNLTGTSNYDLIGRTIYLMSAQMTTDTFGPMPMHPEAGGTAYVAKTPRYEDQSFIYDWMLKEADALIAAYESYTGEGDKVIDVTQDRVYAGDLNMWKGLVYAIKARILLRNIPNVDLSKCDEIIANADAAINTWRSGNLRYGTWFGNEPRYKFDGGAGTLSCPWSSAQPKINSWESRDNLLTSAVPSKYFVQDMLGVSAPGDKNFQGTYSERKYNGFGNDPRIMLLMKPTSGPAYAGATANKVMIRFLENNIGAGSSFKQANYPDLFAGAYAGATDAYNCIFTMEELYFIKAEAEYWKGNKIVACALAKEATEMNIQRHLEDYINRNGGYPGYHNSAIEPGEDDNAKEIDRARFQAFVGAFLNNEETTVEYKNVSATGKESIKSYTSKAVSEINNERFFFNPETFSLSDLMQQKWIAMYMQPEQWTDMRRYKYSNRRNGTTFKGGEIVYPTLRRPYNLYSAYWVDGLTDEQKETTWIQRLNYDPQTEDIYNEAEVRRVGAYKDFRWLQKPMIWAESNRTSLTAE